jgi:putative hydrolase of the HAD superfamily
MLKAVVFDLGGTLLHYQSASADIIELNRRGFIALYRHLAANGNAKLPEATFLSAVETRAMSDWKTSQSSLRGMSVESSLKTAMAELGLPLTNAEWPAARQAFFAPIHQAARLRAGARYTLQALKELGLDLGLLSNTFWPADLHDADLANLGLLDFLPMRLYSCDIGWLKPHPAAFHMALNALKVKPTEAVYVGDRLKVDIEPARRIGFWGVLIQTPFRLEHSKDIMPDAVISELPELVKLLERRR